MKMTDEEIRAAADSICLMRHRHPAKQMSDEKYRKRVLIDQKLAEIRARKEASCGLEA